MSVERAKYDAATGWVVYQGTAPGTPLPGLPPVVVYTATLEPKTKIVTFDARGSVGIGASIGRYDWDFGDGSGLNSDYVLHEYTTADTFNVTLSVTDSKGHRASATFQFTVAENEPPVANLNVFATDLTATYSAAGSSDPDGGDVTYDVDWGDGSDHATDVTGSHEYASSGLYNISLTVTDQGGLTAISSSAVALTIPDNTPTPVPNPVPGEPTQPNPGQDPVTATGTPKTPWKSGSETQDLPSSVRVIKWNSIAKAGDDTNPQRAINRMDRDAVIDISGEALTIPSFIGDESPNGLYSSRLLGFIGGVSNGRFDNLIELDSNAMTSSQAAKVAAQGNGDTSRFSIIRLAPGKRQFIMGVHMIGADQPNINDPGAASQYPKGPARHKGLNVNLADDNSIFQNCLLQGFGASNGHGPPWETGSVDSRRTSKFLVRRVEMDGRLPSGSISRPTPTTSDPYGRGWKRTGGFQWNADKTPTMIDFSLHDTLVSSLTSSIAGNSNSRANMTEDIRFTRVYIEDNSLKGFSGMNFEMVLDSIHLDHCWFKMNGTGGQHMQINPRLTKPRAPNISDIVITEPTWSGLGYNGMFTIGIFSWGEIQKTPPKVIKNGRVLAPKTSNADPALYYRIVDR